MTQAGPPISSLRGGEHARGRRLVGRTLLLYLAFVIYGSLVPLDFRPMPIESAWQAFGHTRLLDVGAAGRADWIANGVLYFPLGFLAAALLLRRSAKQVTAVLGAMALVVPVAITVEFVQLFFPPRTVSLNDLLAEFIGGGVGAALAVAVADRLRGLLRAWVGGAERLAPWLLWIYALAYCAFSFFPFDLVISSSELAEKAASANWGWLWASGIGRGSMAAGAAKLLAEILASLPLGWLVASRGWTLRRAIAGGLLLGTLIEIGQFFIVSGVAQGLSIATRALGVGAGVRAWELRRRLDPLAIAWNIRRFAVPLLLLYLLALVAVTGWFELPLRGRLEAGRALEDVRFLPFYYHYYTTEQAALLSLTSICLMYVPVGVLAWAAYLGPGMGALIAALLAALVETSKLFLSGLHPDPTNLLVAGVAAWLTERLASGVEKLALARGPRRKAGGVQAMSVQPASSAVAHAVSGSAVRDSVGRDPEVGCFRRPGGVALAGLVLAGVAAALGIALFPLYPVLLGLLLAGYGVALWWRPHYLWVAVPAALPMLDLAPWSGRFFIDEFDLLLLVSVAIGLARLAPPTAGARNDALRVVTTLLALIYGMGVMRGLLPWQPVDVNAFSHYYSPYNALRIGKGVVWALLLASLAARSTAAGLPVFRPFGTGMIIGLAGTTAVVIWERWTFTGLFDFIDVYRVTGPFSAMHVGGADLECYLTAGVPFLVWRLLERGAWTERALGLVLLVGSTYALMVSFSRAGYVAYGLALLVTAGLAVLRRPVRRGDRLLSTAMNVTPAAALGDGTVEASASGQRARQRGSFGPMMRSSVTRGVGAAALLVIVTGVTVPILLGGFAQERLAQSGEDLAVRAAHWRDALAMRDPDLATSIFGMGLGRFPVTHYWRSEESRAAGFLLVDEGDGRFLRLGSGSPVYVEQFVALQPGRTYELRLRARAVDGTAALSASLCEKWLLTSARCAFQTQPVSAGDWQAVSIAIASGEVGSGPWYRSRPIKLSLYNSSEGRAVDVDDVRLMLGDGQSLLSNGNFADGLDRWFFSADVDLPWHIWSQPVTVLFEMGWLGVLVLGGVALIALVRGARWAWRGEEAGVCLLSAALGWACLGVVDGIGDSPRMLMLGLFVMSCLFALNSLRKRLASGARRG